jgi:hypothetical protein
MTPGAARVLREMAEDADVDLVHEGREAWCGCRRTTPRVVVELLRLAAIKASWMERDGAAAFYEINETGRALLRRPELEGEVAEALARGRTFTVRDDRVVFI